MKSVLSALAILLALSLSVQADCGKKHKKQAEAAAPATPHDAMMAKAKAIDAAVANNDLETAKAGAIALPAIIQKCDRLCPLKKENLGGHVQAMKEAETLAAFKTSWDAYKSQQKDYMAEEK
jgi:hypothetical protein